jgi:ankyrin repeat protein
MLKFKEFVESTSSSYFHDDFIKASEKNKIETLKRLLKHGVDIHKDAELLIDSAWRGELELIKFLASQGADLRAKNDMALTNASYGGALDVVRYLVEKGSQLNIGYMGKDAKKRSIQGFIAAVGDTVEGQEQIIKNYLEYIDLLREIKSELKTKYSHIFLGSKFGIFNND